jgi:hypothetical protein
MIGIPGPLRRRNLVRKMEVSAWPYALASLVIFREFVQASLGMVFKNAGLMVK